MGIEDHIKVVTMAQRSDDGLPEFLNTQARDQNFPTSYGFTWGQYTRGNNIRHKSTVFCFSDSVSYVTELTAAAPGTTSPLPYTQHYLPLA